MSRRRGGILALAGVLAPALFATTVLVCAGLRPGYRHLTHYMSELGETGSTHAELMIYAGFLPTGALLLLFAVALYRAFGPHRLAKVGSGLIAVFGLGVFSAGVFSCDPGCPAPFGVTLEGTLHNVVSVIAFVGATLAPGVWGSRFASLEAWRPLARYSRISSVVAAALFATLFAVTESRFLVGLWQRLFLAVPFLWCAVVGARLWLGHPAGGEAPERSGGEPPRR